MLLRNPSTSNAWLTREEKKSPTDRITVCFVSPTKVTRRSWKQKSPTAATLPLSHTRMRRLRNESMRWIWTKAECKHFKRQNKWRTRGRNQGDGSGFKTAEAINGMGCTLVIATHLSATYVFPTTCIPSVVFRLSFFFPLRLNDFPSREFSDHVTSGILQACVNLNWILSFLLVWLRTV